MDLPAMIDANAAEAPERLAHRSDGRSLSYGELRRRSDHLAAWLARDLPERGLPVAIVGHKEPEMLVGFLACLKAGHPYVPIDTALPPQRVDRIVTTSGAPLVLTPGEIDRRSDGTDPPPRRAASPDEIHYIMFTSGSTGEPKGVPITRGAVGNFIRWILAEQAPRPGREVFLNQTVYSFDVSVMDSLVGLACGGTVFGVTRDQIADARRLYAALADSRVTIWVSTPSFATLCLVERSFDQRMLPDLRRFLFCGEALPPDTARRLLDRFPGAEVWNTYGPTEATVATTSVRIDREILARYAPLPIGYPMPGSRVLPVDEALRPVAEGERGEIIIAGPNVSPGYLHRPDLTARAFFRFEDLPAYRTGDWGFVRDGLLFFEGRIDGQIKLHGYRVELGDVESNLSALPGVLGAAVLPVIKDGHATALNAFVVLAERPAGTDFEIAEGLRRRLAERLPGYMVPRRVNILEAFPMTPNGKIDRRRLAEPRA